MEESPHKTSQLNVLRQSMIRQTDEAGWFVKCVSTVDIFSFIPVPKSKPVSTRCSLIGTLLFFSIFLAYIIYDIVTFITDNPPIPNSFYEKLDYENYTSPKFSMVFMQGDQLNTSVNPTGYFNYTLQQNVKKQKDQFNNYSSFVACDSEETKKWMGESTFNNYNENLVCPKYDKPLYVGGLLYVYEYASSPSIKILQCYNQTEWCKDRTVIETQQAKGRLFLFIEVPDGSEYNQESAENGSYRLYNFFLVQEVYNRINVQFQVNKQIILPDYLTRWTQKQNKWLEITGVTQMNSNVAPLSGNVNATRQKALLLSIQFTLNPSVKVTKIAYSTLIDHVAQWGALWGVEFAIFAIFFLSYNSKKYYKKNPKWEKYDEVDESNNVIATDS